MIKYLEQTTLNIIGTKSITTSVHQIFDKLRKATIPLIGCTHHKKYLTKKLLISFLCEVIFLQKLIIKILTKKIMTENIVKAKVNYCPSSQYRYKDMQR